MFNLRLCNATIRYSLLKFGHMHLCCIDNKYFSPHCCKCTLLCLITRIIVMRYQLYDFDKHTPSNKSTHLPLSIEVWIIFAWHNNHCNASPRHGLWGWYKFNNQWKQSIITFFHDNIVVTDCYLFFYLHFFIYFFFFSFVEHLISRQACREHHRWEGSVGFVSGGL